MTEESKTYNGWTNRETWAVQLWIYNDEGEAKFWEEKAKGELETAVNRDRAIYGLSRLLELGIVANAPIEKASLYSDLLTGALELVNWREIAESLIEGLE